MIDRICRTAVVAFAAIVAPIAASPAQAQSMAEFNLPSQDLGKSLRSVASMTHTNLVFDPAQISGRVAPALKGHYTAAEAIGRLLARSGLKLVGVGENSWVVSENKKSPIPTTLSGEAAERELAPIADSPASNSSIVVTGTRLRNIEAVASPLTSYSRADIERAARADIGDFLQVLPQNFSGGAYGLTPDGLYGPGAQTFLNPGGSVSPNLRGLGPGSTLTLVNGHRVAPSAASAFVDIGVIPQSMIERIDIVADGASAVYGSDAVGGVVNIILKDEIRGAETSAHYETVDKGGYSSFDVTQSLGTSWKGGGIIVSGRYRDRKALAAADRSFSKDVPGIDRPDVKLSPDLYPAAKEYSVLAAAHHDVTTGVRLDVDGWYSGRDQDQTVGGYYVSQFKTKSRQFTTDATLSGEVGSGIRLSGSGGYATSRENIRQNNYTQSGGQDYSIFGKLNFDLWHVGGTVAGAIAHLPAGDLQAALGAEHRNEQFLFGFGGDFGAVERHQSRRVTSAYGELLVPLIDTTSGPLNRLAASFAGRYDHYSDFGSAWTGKAGLTARLGSLHLRTNYSTAFRAPTLNDLSQAGTITVLGDPYDYASPDRPGDTARVINLLGYSKLKPEKARIWTAGFDFRSPAIPGFKTSATYFRYDYRDRLGNPPDAFDILLRPEIYGGIYRPVSSGDEVQQIIDNALANGGQTYFYDPTIPLSAYEYIVDLTFRNLSTQRVKGIDLDAEYTVPVGAVSLTGRAAATFIFSDLRQITQGSEGDDFAGLFGQQPKSKLRAELSAMRGPLTVNAALNRIAGLRNTNVAGNPRSSAFTMVDLNVQYRLTGVVGRETRFLAGVRNLFNEQPPFVERSPGAPSYDPANANPLGRIFQISFTQGW